MGRVLGPLQQMGLEVEGDRDRLPLTCAAPPRSCPSSTSFPVPSAQVKSAILLAGLSAAGATTVIESEPTRDHTERMLRVLRRATCARARQGRQARTSRSRAMRSLQGRDVTVPGDPSSAAFLAAAALLVPGSDVTIEGVLVNPTRTGFYLTLQEMGGDVALPQRARGGRRARRRHPRARLQAQGRARCRPSARPA